MLTGNLVNLDINRTFDVYTGIWHLTAKEISFFRRSSIYPNYETSLISYFGHTESEFEVRFLLFSCQVSQNSDQISPKIARMASFIFLFFFRLFKIDFMHHHGMNEA